MEARTMTRSTDGYVVASEYSPACRYPALPAYQDPSSPSGDAKLYEIKHDGFQVIARACGSSAGRVALSRKFLLIAEAPACLRS
jgi:hypothetical protein